MFNITATIDANDMNNTFAEDSCAKIGHLL